MKIIIVLIFLMNMWVLGLAHAQDDGSTYTCDGGENDILIAAQVAYDASDWAGALTLADKGEDLCAGNVLRYRDVANIGVNAQAQLDIIETQAFIDESYPGMVDFGDYSVFMRCVGEASLGTPTIIFEHGLGTSVAQTWTNISPEFEAVTQVCTYDRAGVGLSGSLPGNSERTTQDMVNDLVHVLDVSGIQAPYILVGHSIAGFNILLFADQYPDIVAGIVLVDASHPDQLSRVAEIDPSNVPPEDAFVSSERMNLWASSAEVGLVDAIGDIPLFVLTAGDNTNPDTAPNPAIAEIWLELQEDHAARSSNSQHIIVEDAPHFIMQTDPDVVIAAIDWVWEEATGEDRKSVV